MTVTVPSLPYPESVNSPLCTAGSCARALERRVLRRRGGASSLHLGLGATGALHRSSDRDVDRCGSTAGGCRSGLRSRRRCLIDESGELAFEDGETLVASDGITLGNLVFALPILLQRLVGTGDRLVFGEPVLDALLGGDGEVLDIGLDFLDLSLGGEDELFALGGGDDDGRGAGHGISFLECCVDECVATLTNKNSMLTKQLVDDNFASRRVFLEHQSSFHLL